MSCPRYEVRGTHTISLPPERAVVAAQVSLEGPDAEPVAAAAAHITGLREQLDALSNGADGPVAWYSIDQSFVAASADLEGST